jgi:DNA repair protein RadD
MTQIVPRDYQEFAINEGINFFKDKKDKKNRIISAPCGSGKSIIIAGIVNQLDNTIVLQPSKELLIQNYAKFTQFGGNATIFSASVKEKNMSNTCFATIGSIKNLAKEFKEIGITNIILDECHVFANKDTGMFKTFVKQLGTGVKILGLTATPYKSVVVSGESLYDNYSEIRLLNRMSPKMFSDVLVNITNKYIYENNYWKKLEYQSKQVDSNLLKLNSTGADYTEESLKLWYNFNDLDRQIIKEVETQITLGKRTILIFVPNVQIATNLQKFISNSEVVSSQTKYKDRTRIVTEFLNKPKDEVKILLNFGTLTTGFDAPHLDLILNCRATNSLSLWSQIVGRLVRKSDYVETGTFIDFTENLKKFGKIEDIDLAWVDGEGWLLMKTSDGQILNNVRLDSRFDKVYKHQIVKGCVPKQSQISLMPFGKYKDLPINSEKIDTDYLQFCLKNVKFNGIFGKINKTIIENELIRRNKIK